MSSWGIKRSSKEREMGRDLADLKHDIEKAHASAELMAKVHELTKATRGLATAFRVASKVLFGLQIVVGAAQGAQKGTPGLPGAQGAVFGGLSGGAKSGIAGLIGLGAGA